LYRQRVGIAAGASGTLGSLRHTQDCRQFTPHLDPQGKTLRVSGALSPRQRLIDVATRDLSPENPSDFE